MSEKDRLTWIFTCQNCYVKFPTIIALEDHLNRRLFKCGFHACNRKFVHKKELVKHQKVCSERMKNSAFDSYHMSAPKYYKFSALDSYKINDHIIEPKYYKFRYY